MAHSLRPALRTREPIHAAPVRGIARPSLDDVWASLAVLVPVIVSLATTLVATDLAYHIRAGEQVLGGSIPRTDTWTFTIRGVAWVDQQWGAQALLALAHGGGGFATIAVLRAVLIGATFGLVYLACRVKRAAPRSASLLALGGFLVCLQTLSMRPQLFGVASFAASLWVLAGRRDRPARLWALPFIALAWANLHGSFVLAPLLVLLALGEDLIDRTPGRRRLAVVGAVTALATLLNPFGFGAWTYAWRLGTNPLIRSTVTEWAPTSLATFSEVAFFATAAGVVAWLVRRRGAIPWGALLWLVTFFLLALPARRGVVWWALVAPVAVAGIVGRGKERAPREGSRLANAAVIGAIVAVAILLLPGWRSPSVPTLMDEAPAGLSDATAALPAGSRLLVSEPWGSWFAFASPSTPLFVDPRLELYPQDVWDDYVTVATGSAGWGEILDRYRVDAVVLDRRTWGSLLAQMRADPGWRQTYADPDGELLVRAEP